MIGNQIALLKRELWENRSIYIAPLVIGGLISLLTLTGQVTISAFGEAVDLAIIGAQNTVAISPQSCIPWDVRHCDNLICDRCLDRDHILQPRCPLRGAQRQKHFVLALAASYRHRNRSIKTANGWHRNSAHHTGHFVRDRIGHDGSDEHLGHGPGGRRQSFGLVVRTDR